VLFSALSRDPRAVNAAYWIGETYYAEKAFDKAVLQFEDVIQKYGDDQGRSALYKQALAFDALKDRKSARLVMKKVIERFPLAEETKKAKEKLKEWAAEALPRNPGVAGRPPFLLPPPSASVMLMANCRTAKAMQTLTTRNYRMFLALGCCLPAPDCSARSPGASTSRRCSARFSPGFCSVRPYWERWRPG